MATRTTPPWIDGIAFINNRNKVQPELDPKLWGHHLAWEVDGTGIIAHHSDFFELVKILEQMGLTTSDVVFDQLSPDPNIPEFYSWDSGSLLSGRP